MKKMFTAALVVAAAVALPQSAAFAATTVDVSTGRGGVPGQTDATWTVTGPGLPATQAFIPINVNAAWVGGPSNTGSASKWITPGASGNVSRPAGSYTYTTVFSLPDVTQLTQKILQGRFWSDNQVYSILLNGDQIYSQDNPNFNANEFGPNNFKIFSSPVTFTNFLTGQNTLVVNLFNGSSSGINPTGLNLEAAFTASAVPEPATWLLMLIGFGAIGFSMRSRSRGRIALLPA